MHSSQQAVMHNSMVSKPLPRHVPDALHAKAAMAGNKAPLKRRDLRTVGEALAPKAASRLRVVLISTVTLPGWTLCACLVSQA